MLDYCGNGSALDSRLPRKDNKESLMFFSCNVAPSVFPHFGQPLSTSNTTSSTLCTVVMYLHITRINYTALASQALSAPLYLVALFVVILTVFLLTKLKLLCYLSRSARWLWLPLYRYSGRAQSELWLEIRWSLPCSCRLLLLYHAHPYLDDQQSGL